MAVELAVGYVTLVPSARGITKGIEAEMGGPLLLAGRTSGTKSSAAFGTAFKSGLKTAAIGVGVIAGIAAVGKNFEDAFNKIERGTGATGKTLEGLDNSFRTVLKNGAGSFDQVSTAITVLHQRTGLTGKALEDFAAKQVTLARITKTDVAANLQSTTALFNLYGIAVEKQSGSLDVLFKASQVAGISVTDLASSLQAAAPTAKILGLNLGQTASLVAGLEKAGLPASRVMLGLASSFAKASKQGREPIAVIKDLIAQVKQAPTATDAARIAVTRFGISARAAAVLVAGIRSGAVDLTKSLDAGKGILATAAATATLAGKFAHLKNVALVGLEPIATSALGAITKGVEFAIPAVSLLADHMQILGPVIIAAVAGFAAFKIALGVQAIINGLSLSFGALRLAIFGVADAEVVAAVASKGLLATIGPIGFIAAAIGVALAVVTLQTHLFGKGQADAGKETNSFIASLLDEGKALKDVAGQVLVKAIRDNKDLADTYKAAGIPLARLSDALAGNGRAQDDVRKKLEAYRRAQKDIIGVETARVGLSREQVSQHADLDRAVDQATQFVDRNARSIDKQSDAKKRGSAASKELAAGEVSLVSPAKQAALAQDQLRIAATNLTSAIINNVDRLRGLQEGLVGVLQSAINLRTGLRDVADKQKALTEAQSKYGRSSKEAAVAADDLALAQLSQIGSTAAAIDGAVKQADAQSHLSDHLKAQQKAVEDLAKAQSDFNSGKGSPDAVAAAQDNLDRATKSVADSQDIQRTVIERLAARVSGPLHVALLQYLHDTQVIPDKKETKVETPGLVPAAIRFHNYRGEMGKLPGVKHTKIELDANKALADLFTLKSRILQLPSNVPFTAVVRGEGGRIPGGAHGLVAKKPTIALIGENARTTPEIVSPVKLMAQTFKAELRKEGHGRSFGPISTKVDGTGRLAALLQELFDEHDRELTMALGAGTR